MRDNIFANVFEEPFAANEEWVSLFCDNRNCAPGDDVPSLAAYRGIRAAATIFIIRRGYGPRDIAIENPIAARDFDAGERLTLAARVKNWFPTVPV